MSINDLDKRLITGLLIPIIQEQHNKELADLQKKYIHLRKLINKETKYYIHADPDCNKIKEASLININDLDKRLITGLLIPIIQERHNKKLADLQKKYNHFCELISRETKHHINICPVCNKIELIYYDGNNPYHIKCNNCID